MGKSVIMASGTDTSIANTTEYLPYCGGIFFTGTENQIKIPFREAGVISNLAVVIGANSIAGSSTFRLRKNNANGNQVVTVGSSATGYFEDTTNTDTIAAGDGLDIMFTPGASTNTLTVYAISFIFTPTDSTITHSRFANTQPTTTSISQNYYHNVSGLMQNTLGPPTAMTQAQITPKIAGTFKHFALYSASGTGRAVRMEMCKNSTDPLANTILIASASTGLGENTATNVTVNGSTDNVNILIGTGGGSGTRTLNFVAASFENVGNYFLFINGRAEGNSESSGVTRYYALGGRIINYTTEVGAQTKARIPMRISKLGIYVLSNTLNGSVVFTFRKNGANGNQTVTIPAGNTGFFEDASNIDVVDAADLIDIQSVNGGTSGSITYTLMTALAEYYPLRNLVQTISQSLALTSDHVRKRLLLQSMVDSLTFASTHPRLRNKIRNVGNVLDSDNFDAGTYSFTEGGTSPNGKWTNNYLGGTGATSGVRVSNGNNVMFQKPQASTSSIETHATLNMFNTTYGDFDLTVDLRNVAQLRTGSSPNAWEVAWILFRFTDNWHHYYLALKTSGIELGRKDYATMIEQQIFLVTNGSPATVLGRWEYIRLRAIGNRFTVWVNGVLAFDFVDDGSVGYDTNTGTTPAPPSAAMYGGKIGLYNEDAEVEFDNFSVAEIQKLTLSTTQPRYRGRAKSIAESLGFTSAHSRLTNRLRTIAQSLGFTSAHSRLKTILGRTIAQSLAFTSSHPKYRGLNQTISDSLTFVHDTIQTSGLVKTIAEALAFTSSHVRLTNRNRTISQSLGLTSTHSRLTTRLRTIAQSLGFTSNHVRIRGLIQTITDSFTVSSNHVKIRGKWRTVADSLGLTSSHVRLTTRLRSIAQSLAFTSSHVRIRGLIQTISNSLGFSATMTEQRNKVRTISQTLGFSSSHTWLQIGTKIQVIAENLNISADFVVERFKSFYIKLFMIKGNK